MNKEEGSSKQPPQTTTAATTMTAGCTDATDELDALVAMWSSLLACTSPLIPSGPDGDGNSNDDAVMLPTTTTTTPLPSTTALVLPRPGPPVAASVASATATAAATAATAASLDGLVLVFVSSPATNLVHCFDVTVRCNPPPTEQQQRQRQQRARGRDDWEDWDGWRGYFAPLAPRTTTTTTTTTTETDSSQRIVALAVCRAPPRSVVTGRAAHAHRPIQVACLSKNQLVIWEDPHLSLWSCKRPLAPPHTTPAVDGNVSTCTTPWKSRTDGNARVVDICPGMVAVGTDTGVVLVYLYTTTTTTTPAAAATTTKSSPAATHTNTSTTPSFTGTLRPYLRIPPPPQSTRMQVVSVKLSKTNAATDQRASIFVSYQPAADGGGAASLVDPPNHGGNGSHSSGSGSGAGVCCYEMPLFGTATVTLSAPSARHDLDGRPVASPALVDAQEHAIHGMELTVVCYGFRQSMGRSIGQSVIRSFFFFFSPTVLFFHSSCLWLLVLGSTGWTIQVFQDRTDRCYSH